MAKPLKTGTPKSSGITSLSNERARLHLRSNSAEYAEDSAIAYTLRKRTEAVEGVPISHPTTHKFPSLKQGLWCRPHGTEFEDAEFDEEMSALVATRGHYFAPRSDNPTVLRRRKHNDPVQQLPTNFRPDHAAAFAKLDNSGHEILPTIKGFGSKLAELFGKLTPYEVVATVVHPQSGNLHFHTIFAVVGATGELLHARNQRGRHGMRTAGMGLIGSLRLVDVGLLSEERAEELQSILLGRYSGTEQPVDWILSENLDGMVEAWVQEQPVETQTVFAEEERLWLSSVKARLESTPRALEERIDHVTAENDRLMSELSHEQARLVESRKKQSELKAEAETLRQRLLETEVLLARGRTAAANVLSAQRDVRGKGTQYSKGAKENAPLCLAELRRWIESSQPFQTDQSTATALSKRPVSTSQSRTSR